MVHWLKAFVALSEFSSQHSLDGLQLFLTPVPEITTSSSDIHRQQVHIHISRPSTHTHKMNLIMKKECSKLER